MSNAGPKQQFSLVRFRDFATKYFCPDFIDFRTRLGGPFLIVRIAASSRKIVNLGPIVQKEGGSALIIGRDLDCDLPIPAKEVSRQHARLGWNTKNWSIMDLGSTNGVMVGGKSLDKSAMSLNEGDTIFLGTNTRLFLLSAKQIHQLVLDVHFESTKGSGAYMTGQTLMLNSSSESSYNIDSPALSTDRLHRSMELQRRLRPPSGPAPKVPTNLPPMTPGLVTPKAPLPKPKKSQTRPIPHSLFQEQRTRPRDMLRFVDEVQNMDEESFLRTFPHPCLMRLVKPRQGTTKDTCDKKKNVKPQTHFNEVAFWVIAPENPERGMVIGRVDTCDVVIPHESISRRHAVICCISGKWRFRDLASTNGSWVNGERSFNETVLGKEAVIRLGGDFLLQFMDPHKLWDFVKLFNEYPHISL